ncbi:MAG: class I SAM-dependent methyltransferase [Cytophagales bacterium]|nr:class I SAM-dependent methyltransferase [Cytophagales bacterium]
MDFIPPDLARYAEAHTSPEPQVLRQLNRETHANVLSPRMLSGHLQGRVLALLSHLVKPSRVLEIGTYTGYSALCLAEGLAPGGKVITLDVNEELERMVRSFVEKAGMTDRVDFRIGRAADLIPQLDETFDLVFIDADKVNYGLYYDLVFDKVRPGGIIVADNVLWSGKVVQPEAVKKDKELRAILAFNARIQQDDRVENVLLPLRDGLMVVRKK